MCVIIIQTCLRTTKLHVGIRASKVALVILPICTGLSGPSMHMRYTSGQWLKGYNKYTNRKDVHIKNILFNLLIIIKKYVKFNNNYIGYLDVVEDCDMEIRHPFNLLNCNYHKIWYDRQQLHGMSLITSCCSCVLQLSGYWLTCVLVFSRVI